MRRRIPVIGTVGILIVVATGGVYAQSPVPEEATTGTARTIYMAAVEPKGGTTVDSEPYPTEALPPGAGYNLVEPNDEGRWEVSTYRWMPGTIVVNQGDEVTLEIIGINGAEHPFTIEGYDMTGTVTRGHVTTVAFTADKAGIFSLVCTIHLPSMTTDLVVLPAS